MATRLKCSDSISDYQVIKCCRFTVYYFTDTVVKMKYVNTGYGRMNKSDIYIHVRPYTVHIHIGLLNSIIIYYPELLFYYADGNFHLTGQLPPIPN
jgi:hypothetical protein